MDTISQYHTYTNHKILNNYFSGDIQKFSQNLPGFLWSRYPGEKHIPSYNYLGPGTRLDIRLQMKTINQNQGKNQLMQLTI